MVCRAPRTPELLIKVIALTSSDGGLPAGAARQQREAGAVSQRLEEAHPRLD